MPEAKLIFVLRDPVARTYSHYWHLLKSGRATYRFEDQLQYNPRRLFERSFYRKHAERYLAAIPHENIKFLIFEDFVRNMQDWVDALCAWLGLSKSINLAGMEATASNVARVPRWTYLQRWLNRFFRSYNARKYQHHLPNMSRDDFDLKERVMNSVNYRLSKRNLEPGSYPPMSPGVESFLQKLFAMENRALSDLIEVDAKRYWSYMDG